MTSDNWIAIYAAIVATGALALEVRRWFESGPKLTVQATTGMVMIGNGKRGDGLLVVTVINRGDAPTTIKSLGMIEYPNFWAWLRNRPTRAFVIADPSQRFPLPHLLAPGAQWTGIGPDRPELTGDIQTGTMWVDVGTTDRARPYLVRIPKRRPRPELENATTV